jgi:hypothetical protein
VRLWTYGIWSRIATNASASSAESTPCSSGVDDGHSVATGAVGLVASLAGVAGADDSVGAVVAVEVLGASATVGGEVGAAPSSPPAHAARTATMTPTATCRLIMASFAAPAMLARQC